MQSYVYMCNHPTHNLAQSIDANHAGPPQTVFCCGKTPLSLMDALTVRSSGLPKHDGGGGGGDSSHCASPNQSPKSMVGKFELTDIPISWDNDPAIRERIRNGLNLCAAYDPKTGNLESKYVDATPENLRVNAPVLKPVVTRMRDHDLQLPAIDKLKTSSVDQFFQLAKLTRSMDDCYQEAWAIRRLIGKLKRYTYRNVPPQDCFGLLPQKIPPSSLHFCISMFKGHR